MNVPTTLYWPAETAYCDHCPYWPRWFEIGGRRLGWQIVYSPEMAALSDCGNGVDITCAEIERHGKRRRVWFDWTDWREHRPGWQRPGDAYFSLDFPPELRGVNRFPLPLNPLPRGANMAPWQPGDGVYASAYETALPRLRALRQRCIESGEWKHDVVFVGRSEKMDYRGEAALALHHAAKEHGWRSLIRIAPFHGQAPSLPKELAGRLLGIVEHWEAQAQSRVCIALPGIGGVVHQDWSWRHTEATGIGCTVLTAEPNSDRPGAPPWHYCRRDLADLVDVAGRLIEAGNQSSVFESSMNYYRDYLSPEGQIGHVVRCLGDMQ